MRFAEHDHMVQAFPADRADEPVCTEKFGSAWTQGSDGVILQPDGRPAQADSRIVCLALQIEGESRGGSPDPPAADQCASPADADTSAPVVRYLPSNLWLIGLGHLGQAYLWALGLLPYPQPTGLSLVLQCYSACARRMTPAPIKAAREVGRILKHIEFGTAVSPDFRKYT